MAAQSSQAALLKHSHKMLKKIVTAHQKLQTKQANEHTRGYLHSFGGRLSATLEAWRNMPVRQRPSKSEIQSIAQSLNAWQGTDEPVRIDFVPKSGPNQDYRPVMSFGIQHRALQRLVLNVLRVRADLHALQFFTKGGVHAAIAEVVAAKKAGYVHCIQTDIASCFSAFNANALSDLLPLPKEVTQHVIKSTHYNLVSGNCKQILGNDVWSEPAWKNFPGAIGQYVSAARSGLPQGSAASPMVAEMMIAPVMHGLDMNSGALALAYADNILIMAKEANGAEKFYKALWSALEGHPAGPLKPSWTRLSEPNEAFDFLGYCIEPDPYSAMHVRPSNDRFQAFYTKRKKLLNELEKAHTSQKAMVSQRYCGFVKGWTAAFSLWPDSAKFRDEQLSKLQ